MSDNADPNTTIIVDNIDSDRLLTKNFALATLANFFNSFGGQMMNTVLPVYVISIGGTNVEAGLVSGLLAFSALLFRPAVGWITDVWKRHPLILIGSAFYGLASIVYANSVSLVSLLFGRTIHGFGISSYTTASNAYIMDIAPLKRRAEALGIFSATNSLGRMIGPAIGFYIISLAGFRWLFYLSTLLALIAIGVSLFTKERYQKLKGSPQKWSVRSGIMVVDAIPIAWIALCIGLALGTVNTFIAIFASSQGIENPGFYFTVQAITLLLARAFFGRLADKLSRSASIIPGIIAMSLGLGILPIVQNLEGYMVSAALLGLGFGMAQPATMALLADHVRQEQQGLGIATYYIGFDGGISLGSIIFGLVSETWGFSFMWILSAVCTLLGLLGLIGMHHTRQAGSTGLTNTAI